MAEHPPYIFCIQRKIVKDPSTMKIAFPREIIPAIYTFRPLLGNTRTFFFVFNLLPGFFIVIIIDFLQQ